MTKEELMKLVADECAKNGWKHIIQIDDGEYISGQYNVRTDSRLHNMARAINALSDHVNETTK